MTTHPLTHHHHDDVRHLSITPVIKKYLHRPDRMRGCVLRLVSICSLHASAAAHDILAPLIYRTQHVPPSQKVQLGLIRPFSSTPESSDVLRFIYPWQSSLSSHFSRRSDIQSDNHSVILSKAVVSGAMIRGSGWMCTYAPWIMLG